ncbi:hypothetical protein G7009_04335 [Pseudomonas capeferrum]|nr:hypothetical protein [Pseudomonas capeferrum]
MSNAKGDIITAETPEALGQSLAEREFWQDYLRQMYPSRFDAADRTFYERLAALEAQMDWTSEQTCLERVEEVARDRRATQHRLIIELTKEALRRHRV